MKFIKKELIQIILSLPQKNSIFKPYSCRNENIVSININNSTDSNIENRNNSNKAFFKQNIFLWGEINMFKKNPPAPPLWGVTRLRGSSFIL